MTFDKSLAADNRLSIAVIPFILLIVITFFSFEIINSEISITTILILIITYLIPIILIFWAYKSKDIYYDDANMYLKGDKGVLTVPFLNVKKITMTSNNVIIMGIHLCQYKIEYLDAQFEFSEIHFWKTINSSEIDEFEEDVKKVNRYFKIEY